jgi:hypothetical protein
MLSSDPLFLAQRENVASCFFQFMLLKDEKYQHQSICFRVQKFKGDYTFKNDTLFFDNKVYPIDQKMFYKYTIQKKA